MARRKLRKHINEEIKVGDIVKLVDGSSLTDDYGTKKYTGDSYEEATGHKQILKLLKAEVIKVDCLNIVEASSIADLFYLQDITVKIGKGIFHISSQFVSTLPKEKTFTRGDRFTIRGKSTYVLSSINRYEMALICIQDGNRYRDPVTVIDHSRVTKDELREMGTEPNAKIIY